jgi:hypothetical protein
MEINRDPGGIQTHDRLLRRQELYSAELPGRVALLQPAKIKKIRVCAKPFSVAAFPCELLHAGLSDAACTWRFLFTFGPTIAPSNRHHLWM